MKRPQHSQLIVALCLIATLVVGTVALGTRSHATKRGLKTTVVVVSSSGERLTTLFDGSRVDPKYSIKNILAKRRALPKCGQKAAPSVLNSLFGPSVVYANCFNCSCGGEGCEFCS
jgi:hypothetical protein